MSASVPRILPYPVMAPYNSDYSNGNAYEINDLGGIAKSTDSLRIEHVVSGDNLVTELLHDRKAEYACTVVAPWCAYRKVFKEGPSEESMSNNRNVHIQVLSFQSQDFSHPVMFQPSIVTTEELPDFRIRSYHGLDELWEDASITIPKTAMIAIAPFYNSQDEARSILSVKKAGENELPTGCFEVSEVAEKGFYFQMLVEPSLYESLRKPGNSFKHVQSMYTFALTQGLEILSQKYWKAEDWNEFSNLRQLYMALKNKGITTWDDEYNFKANRVAAMFHPHCIDTSLVMEDDEY